MSTTPLTAVDTELDKVLIEMSESISTKEYLFWQEKTLTKDQLHRAVYEIEQEANARLKALIGTIAEQKALEAVKHVRSVMSEYSSTYDDFDDEWDTACKIVDAEIKRLTPAPQDGSVTTNPHPDGLEKGDK